MSWISRLHHLLRQFGDRENVSKGQHSDDFVQLYVDRLEDRRVLSVTAALADGVLVDGVLTDDVLQISGDTAADTLIVDIFEDIDGDQAIRLFQLDSSNIQVAVQIDGVGSGGPVASIKVSEINSNRLEIDLGAGEDEIRLEIPSGEDALSTFSTVVFDTDSDLDTVLLVENDVLVAPVSTSLDVTSDLISFASADFQLGTVDIDLTGQLQLTADQTVTTGGDFQLDGNIAGAGFDFVLDVGANEIEINGDIGSTGDALGKLDVTANSISLGGDVFTTGGQTYSADVELSTSVGLSGASIDFDGMFDGGGFDLAITSTDEVSFSQDATNLASLSINATNQISLHDVTTTGNQSYTSALITTNSDYVTNGGDFTVIGDWDIQSSTTVTTGGVAIAAGEIDLSSAVLFTTNPGLNPTVNLQLNASGTTDGNIQFGEAKIPAAPVGAQLIDDVQVVDAADVSFSTQGFAIAGAFTQDAGSGTTTLDGTINAAAIDIETTNIIIATTADVNSSGNIDLTASSISLAADLSADSDITLMSTVSPIVFSGSVEITADDGDGNINVTGNVLGDNTDLAEITFAGTTTIDGNIDGSTGTGIAQLNTRGGKLSVSSLNVAGGVAVGSDSEIEADGNDGIVIGGAATLGGNLTTTFDTANIQIAGPVTLTDSVTFSTFNGMVNVTGGGINGDGSADIDLTFDSIADVNGTIGANLRNLVATGGKLTANAIDITGGIQVDSGSEVEADDGNVDVDGTATLAGNLTASGMINIGGGLTLTRDAFVDHDITITADQFNITGDVIVAAGTMGGPQVRLFTNGTGTITGTVGENLNRLNVQTGGLTAGTIDLSGDLIVGAGTTVGSSTGDVTVAGETELAGSLSAAVLRDITLQQQVTVTGTATLSGLNIDIQDDLVGAAGGPAKVTILGGATVDGMIGGAGNILTLDANTGSVTSTGNINLGGDLIVGTSSVRGPNVTVAGMATLGGTVTADPGGELIFLTGVEVTTGTILKGDNIKITVDLVSASAGDTPNVILEGITDVSGTIGGPPMMGEIGNLTTRFGKLTAGGIDIAGDLIVRADLPVDKTDGVETDMDGISVDGKLVANAIVNSAAAIDIGGISDLGADVTAQDGSISLGTTIVDRVLLTNDVTLTASEQISVAGNVEGSSATDLTLDAVDGTTVAGNIGAIFTPVKDLNVQTGTLTAGGIDITGNLTAASDVMAGIISSADIDVTGNLAATGAVSTTSGDVTVGGNLTTGSTLMSAGLLSVTETSELGGNVTTTGTQTYSGAVILTNDVEIDAGMSDIIFSSTIDSEDGSAFDLIVATSGITRFQNIIGGTDELLSLSVTGDGPIEIGGNVTTTQDQNYGGAVTLTADARFSANDGADPDNNAISFSSTLDGQMASSSNASFITVDDILFTGAVGARSALDSLTFTQANDIQFDSTLNVSGNVQIDSANDLLFQSTIEVGGNFDQQAGTGTTTFNGTAGSGVTGTFDVTTNNVLFANAQVVTQGVVTVQADGSITTTGSGGIDAGAANINLNADVDGTMGVDGGTFTQSSDSTIQTDGDITVQVNGSGNASVANLTAGSAAGVVQVTTGGAIIDPTTGDNPNITGFATALIAGAGIGATMAPNGDFDTAVSQLAFSNTSNTAITNIENDGELTITATGGITTSRSNAGGVIAARSPLTINMPTVIGSGNMTFIAGDSTSTTTADDLTIAADVTHTAGDGFLAFIAGDSILHTSGTISNGNGSINEVRFLADNEGDNGDGIRGVITQGGSGGITADRVSFETFGDAILNNSTTNAIGTVAAKVTGTGSAFNLVNTVDLTVGTVRSASSTMTTPVDVVGITTQNGDVSIDNGTAALTIGSLNAGMSGEEDLTVGNGTVTLTANGVTERSGSMISAANLDLNGTGLFSLDQANEVGKLAADVSGNLIFQDSDALVIGTVTNTGITTNDNNVTLTTGGQLTLGDGATANVNAGAGNVFINSAAGVSEVNDSGILATGLELVGMGAFHLSGNNQVSELAGSINGSLVFNNVATSLLTVGEVGGSVGLTISSLPMTLNEITTAGGLTLDEQLNAAGTAVSLTANGEISQTANGIITADILGVVQDDSGSVPFDVDLCLNNNVGTLSGRNRSLGGTFQFHNDNALSVGGNGTPTGVETNNGDIQIISSGLLTMNGMIDSTAGVVDPTDGNITLSSDGSVVINSVVNAGFDAGNDTGDVFINADGSVALDAAVSADILRIVATGNISQMVAFDANTLGVRQENIAAGISITLNETNSFSSVAATNMSDGGGLTLVSDQNVTIATVNEIFASGKTPGFTETSGVASKSGTIDLTVDGGSLTIGLAGEDISAELGDILLDADGITQDTDSIITGGRLNLRGTGDVVLTEANSISTLAADITGSLNFNDVNSLAIGTVLDSGIHTDGNDVILTTGSILNLGNQSITGAGAIVSLQTDAGGISQNASSTITASELQVLGTGALFNFAGVNQVNTLAANVTGELDFLNGQSLTVGTVTSSLGTTAGITTTDVIRLETTGANSSLTIGTGAMGEGLDSGGSSIFLTSSDAININNDIDSGTTALVSMIANGNVIQTSTSAITAQRLAVIQDDGMSGDIDLCGDNLVDLFAARNDANGGTIRFHSENNLSIGTQPLFTAVIGVTSNFGDIEITSGGTLTVDSVVNSNNMGGTGDGSIFLGATGSVTVKAAVNATFASMTNTGYVFIASGANIQLDNTVTGDVVRLVSQGDITQGMGDIITANELAARQESTTAGEISLGETNAVATFAAVNEFTSGAITFNNGQAIAIGTVAALGATAKAPAFTQTAGVTTDNGNVTLTVDGAGLTIGTSAGEDLSAGTGTVSITAAGVVEEAGSIISAAHLELLGTGDFDLEEANDVGTLSANVDGDFSFVNDAALIIGTFGGTNGITTAGDDVRIEVTGTSNSLQIGDTNANQNITTSNGNITLISSGQLIIGDGTNGQSLDAGDGVVLLDGAGVNQQAGSTIIASGLELLGTGTFTLAQMNDIDILAAEIDGDFTFVNTGALSVGTVDGDDGTAANGSVGITTGGGHVSIDAGLTTDETLTVDAEINTEDGAAGTGGVVSVNSVEINAALVAGTGDITLNGGGCDLIINADQSTVSSAIYQANCDIIIGAVVSTTGAAANLTFTADADSDGSGGVQIQSAGAVVATGDILIEGSDLAITPAPGVLDAVFIAADGGNTQVDADGSLTIQSRTTTNIDADIIIQGNINSDSGPLAITANRDVVVGANVVTGAGDVIVTAGDNAGPTGGVHVTTVGQIHSGGGVTLTGSDLTTSMGLVDSVRIDADGANDQVLAVGNTTIESGLNAPPTADVVIAGQLHSTTGNIGITANQNVLLSTLVTADTGNVTLFSDVILDGDSAITAGGDATFDQTINDDGNGTTGSILVVSAAGTTTFSGAIGNTAAIESLTSNNGGTTEVNGNITVVNNIQFDDAVVLTSSISITSNADDITFNSTVDAANAANEQLTLTASMGDILFAGDVGTTELGGLTISDVQSVTSNGDIRSGFITQTSGAGTTAFNGAVSTSTSAGIDLTGNEFTFGDLAGVDDVTTTGAGTVTISNSGQLTINSNANFVLTGEFNQLGGGNVAIGADLSTTDDDVTFTNNVDLIDMVSISTGIGNVLFTSAVDDDGVMGTNSDLTITANGTTRFNATVGTSDALDSLTLTGGGLAELEGDVTTVNDITIDDAIVLTNSIVITSTTGSVFFNSTVDSEATELNTLAVSAPGQVLFADDIGLVMDGELGSLTIDDSTDVDLAGNVELNGNFDIDTGAAGTVNIDGVVTTTNSGEVIITNDGVLTLADAASFNLDGAFTQDGSGNVTTGADITTTGDHVSFAEEVTLTENVAIDTGAGIIGDITFTKDVSGAAALLLTAGIGSIAFSTIGSVTAVTGLTIQSAKDVTLNGNVNTAENGNIAITHSGLLSIDNGATLTLGGTFVEDGTGTVETGADISTTADNVTFNSAVTLTDGISINSTGGNISFASTLDGTSDLIESLTLNADSGNIEFANAVGGMTDLGDIVITSAQNVSFDSTVNANSIRQDSGTGTTTFSGAVSTAGATGIDLTGTNFTFGDLTDNDRVLTTGGGGVTITNSGLFDIAANADFDLSGAFLQTSGGTGTVQTAGDITTDGQTITFTNAVTLTDDGLVTFDTTNSGAVATGADIEFLSTLDGDDNCDDSFTLNAGSAGDITFTDTVGSIEPLGDIRIVEANNVTFSDAVTAATLTQVAGNGLTQFDGAVSLKGAGGLTLTATNVTLNSTVDTLAAGNGGGVTIVNSGNLILADSSSFTLDGAFDQSGGGAITTGADISTTADAVQFSNAVTLSEDVSIDTGAGLGNITFLDTVDAASVRSAGLALNGGMGDIRFDGIVGATELKHLAVTSATNATFNQSLSAGEISQTAGTGTTTFKSSVTTTQAAGISLTGTNFTFGDLTDIDNVATTGGGGVTITNSGLLDIAANAGFDLTGAFFQTSGGTGTIQTAGDITTTGQSITFTDAVTLTDNGLVTFDTTNSGGVATGADIEFLSTLDGDDNCDDSLTLNAGSAGNITFTGAVGSVEPLGDILVVNANNVTIQQTFDANSLRQTAGQGTTLISGNVSTKSMTGVDINANVIDVDAIIDVSAAFDGTLRLNSTAGDITVDGNLNSDDGSMSLISADSIDLNGELNTDSGPISITAVNNVTFSNTTRVLSDGGDIAVTADSGDTNNGGFIAMQDGAVIDASAVSAVDSGTITLSADGSVTLGQLTTTNATANAVRVTSKSGMILDGGDIDTDIVADSVGAIVTLNSATGIGTSGDAIDTTIDQLHATVGNGGIDIEETAALTVLNATTTNGTIDITSVGSLTVDNAGAMTNAVSTTGTGEIHLAATDAGSDVNINDGISGEMGSLTIQADQSVNFAAEGDVTTTSGDILIKADSDNEATAGGGALTMANGTLISTATGTVTLDAADDITLGGISTGNATANAVQIDSTSGAIVDGGDDHVDIVADNPGAVVTISSENGIGTLANAIETTIDQVDATVNGTGDLNIDETSALTILTATTTNGSINIDAVGDLTVDDAGAAGNAVSAGAGGFATLTTNANMQVNSEIATNNGPITLQAEGDIEFSNNLMDNGNVSSANGDIQIFSGNAITQDDGLSINAGTGEIRIEATNDITLANVFTTNAGANALLIRSTAGALLDGGETDVDLIANTGAAVTTIETVTGVGTSANPIETSLVTLNLVNSTSGEIELRESDELTIRNLEQNGAGLTDIRSDGTLTIANEVGTGNAVVSNGTGGFHFEATGANTDVQVNDGISATTGDVELIASGAGGDVNVNGDIMTTGGDVTINAANAVTTTFGDDITTTGQAGENSGTVRITANTGGIDIAGDITTNANVTENAGDVAIQASGTADINISGDIAADATANSSAASVTIQNNNSGDLLITGDISAQSANGDGGSVLLETEDGAIETNNINVSAGNDAGSITATASSTASPASITLNGALTALGGATDGSVSLTAADDILDGNDGMTLVDTGDLSLNAGDNIGEITDFVARTGNAIDAQVSGLLRDLSTTNMGEIHLRMTGDLQVDTGAIEPGQNVIGTLLIQTTQALDVGTLAGSLVLSTGDLVGLHAGTVLTLPDAGIDVGTGLTGGTLRLSGTDIVDPSGRNLGKLTAQNLFFISDSTGGATTINVDVDNLDVDLSGNTNDAKLTINNDDAGNVDQNMFVDRIITNGGDLEINNGADLELNNIETNGGSVLVNNGNSLSITSIVSSDAEIRINNSLAAGGGDISIDVIDAGTGNVILDTTANGGQLRDLNGTDANIIAAGLATRTANIPATDIVDQTLEVQIDTFAANADNLGVKLFDETGNLEIGTVDGLSGISVTNAGTDDIIEVVTVGELNINQNVSSDGLADIFLASRGSLDGNDLNLDATITKTGADGDVHLVAGDDITLTSTSQITAANDSNVTVQAGIDINAPDRSGVFINGNGNADILMADGSLISTDSGTLTLNAANDVAISILNAGLGNVVITADDSGLGGTSTNQMGEIRETLTQSTATGEAANIIADDASLTAATGIGSADDIELNVNTVEATNSTSGNIQLFEVVNGGDNALAVTAISNMRGNVDVQTGDGDLTITGPVSTTDPVAAEGTVNIVAGDDNTNGNGDLFIQGAITTQDGSVTLTSEGNNIEFNDDGDVTTTSGRVDVTAGTTDDSGNITQTSGSQINAGDDEITLTANGQITLGQLITSSASSTAVTLTADSGVDSADPGNVLNVDAANGRLVINSITGVAPILTTVDSLDLTNMTSGSVTITETDALDIIKVDQNANASIDLAAGGTMTLVAGEAGVTGTDSPVNLTTTGAGSKVVVNSTLQSTTGKITVNAADNLEMSNVATVETNATELLLVAGDALNGGSATDGSIVMADGAEIIGNNASIDLVADQNIQVGKITTTTDIRLTSLEAAISDSGDTTGVDLTATNLGLDAATGIGSGDALETSVQLLAAENSTSGAIQVDNTGIRELLIGTFNQSPESPGLGDIVGVTNSGNDGGQIGITNVGAVTVNDVVTNSSGGEINLTATADGGDDDHLTVNAQISTAGAGGDISLNGGTDIDVNAKVVAQVDDVLANPNGLAGNVSLVAGRSIIVDAQVGATASEMDMGGNIEMTAQTGNIDVNAPITTPSSSSLEGGNITLNAMGNITIDAQVTASALTQVDPVVPANRNDVEIPNPNTSGNIVFNAGGDITISDTGQEFDIDGNTINGTAGGNVTFGPDVIVRSATGSIIDTKPVLENVVTPQVTATGIAVIAGDYGRDLENTFVYEIVWQAGESDTYSSGQLVSYATPGMPTINAPGNAAGSFIFDNMYFGNPDPLNPASPIPITITLFDDPNINFFANGDTVNEIGQTTVTSEAEVPGEGLAAAVVFDVSIEVPPLEAPRTVFTDALETDSDEITADDVQEVFEGTNESEAARDDLILIIQKIDSDGKVERDRFGRPIQRTLYGGDALELLTDLPELHERLDSGHWKIFTKEGEDGQMMLVEDVMLRDGKPVVGEEGTQDRPPTSEGTQPNEPSKAEDSEQSDRETSEVEGDQSKLESKLSQRVPVSDQQGSQLGLLSLLPVSSVALRRLGNKTRKLKHLAGILIGFLR